MKPKMTLNIYHDSHDARVHAWVTKNLTTHELNAGRVNLVNGLKTKGNGNIRSYMFAALVILNLIGWAWVA